MIQYTLYQKNPASHYLYIDLEIDQVNSPLLLLQLPAWRPGRYELGNFAKNLKRVDVFGENDAALKFRKLNKDLWEITTAGSKKIKVTYSYYSAELTAGSCYVDTKQIYVNPVHCCMFVVGRTEEKHSIILKTDDSYKVACALPYKNKTLEARSFDELADSPFIASPGLQSDSYESRGVKFHLHFVGECRPDFEKIKKDFTAFTTFQIDFWKSFPAKEYHFLFQITPLKYYHGVEHSSSTVIALGPGYAINSGATYEDLLGVSSHELFHTWNIKNIRPAEMLPYDFTRENYARTGYVYEGFTTYYGDKMLLGSDVFDLQQYFGTLEERLQKHFHNFGRYNLSVADSSWETWLDGYVPGAPYRKTNIYDEGSLIAFMLDVRIMRATGNGKTLRDVCLLMYERFGLTGRGYNEEDIISLVNEVSGEDMNTFFSQFVYAANDYEAGLAGDFEYLGIGMEKKPSSQVNEHLFGFKLQDVASSRIGLVAPYSPAWKAGLFSGDEIIAVNDVAVRGNLNNWLQHFSGENKLNVTYISNEALRTCQLEKDRKGNTWFFTPRLFIKENSTQEQRQAFLNWKKG
jgi:predicted metalloprotease with PDZ domain